MMANDFVCSSKNDGTTFFRPVSAKGHTFWMSNNMNKYVVDNNSEYYIVKSIDAKVICDEIREAGLDFSS